MYNVRTLVMITTEPTAMYIVLKGIFPTRRAAMGAAISPPSMSPATSMIKNVFSKMKNVIALERTTKNSERQTDPIT